MVLKNPSIFPNSFLVKNEIYDKFKPICEQAVLFLPALSSFCATPKTMINP